ncbi:MAG TPA: hypothetical protein VNC50_02880, partial [Planctomycetia bacterium]|nr:hypothetical protein [Planctomycetia bacterium]
PTLAYEPWPTFDPALCAETEVEVAVQINGKIRGKVVAAADASDEALLELARNEEKVKELLAGKEVLKSFIVGSRKGKLVSFVIKG